MAMPVKQEIAHIPDCECHRLEPTRTVIHWPFSEHDPPVTRPVFEKLAVNVARATSIVVGKEVPVRETLIPLRISRHGSQTNVEDSVEIGKASAPHRDSFRSGGTSAGPLVPCAVQG